MVDILKRAWVRAWAFALLVWFQGLVAAILGGAAMAGLVMGIEPSKFNFDEGLASLVKVAVGGGLLAALTYLKQSPLPTPVAPAAKRKGFAMHKVLWVMAALALASALAVSQGGCGGVVRDAHTYQQEQEFMAALTERVAGQLLDEAAAHARIGDQKRCAELANDALVASVRVPWHVAKALHLASVRDDDPGPPPLVPTTEAWCIDHAGVR